MATELKNDIQDLKSHMVALETLSATSPPKVPPCEEEGRAKDHNNDKDLQGGDVGSFIPHHTLGKVEYKTLKTTTLSEIPKSSNARNNTTSNQQHYEPREYILPKLDFPKFDGDHP
jgi:hypothetical protein